MKIEQQPQFQPITITLETKEEVNALWGILEHCDQEHHPHENKVANYLSDFLSNHAKELDLHAKELDLAREERFKSIIDKVRR